MLYYSILLYIIISLFCLGGNIATNKIKFNMKDKQRDYDEVVHGAAECLKNKLGRTKGTLHDYKCLWRRVKYYMDYHEIDSLNTVVCKEYLMHTYENRDYCKLSKRDYDAIRAVNVLVEYLETGTILAKKEITSFNGAIGQIMTEYLAQKTALRLAKHTINEYEQNLFRFLCFLNSNNILTISALHQIHILNYLRSIDSRTLSLSHIAIRILRDFFKHLYSNNLIDIDYSGMMPKDGYKNQAKLPSTYSKEEIEKLITSIDRSCATGKRNYAIILLAARLGLRASDIANLKFENLLWEQCTISLRQYKTGIKIELPLLAEVGNAIIDYLKYGRYPESQEPFVFLLARYPFTPIDTPVITKIVQNSIIQTDINIENRRHGPHALRHSLASLLLENKTILPVISEVLGHENTESTRFYLRIDLKSLRGCALEVPDVSPSFYMQKGGFFYA